MRDCHLRKWIEMGGGEANLLQLASNDI